MQYSFGSFIAQQNICEYYLHDLLWKNCDQVECNDALDVIRKALNPQGLAHLKYQNLIYI